MNYAEIKYCDVANGPGVRTSLFVSGCSHHCPGCFNEIAWDFNYGKPFTQDTIDSIIESLKPDYIQGLTLLGGEPFEYSNQKGLLPLVRQVREVLPQKDIWCYSGYLLDKDMQPGGAVHHSGPRVCSVRPAHGGRRCQGRQGHRRQHVGQGQDRAADADHHLLLLRHRIDLGQFRYDRR